MENLARALIQRMASSSGWVVLSQCIGWIYFVCWSVSFYPQIYINFKARSVTGLSIDFVVANFIGFLCYTIFACAMYWNPGIQAEYESRNGGQANLVELNDVIFTLHAVIISVIYIIQVLIYRKPGEGMSKVGVAALAVITTSTLVAGGLSLFKVFPWLDFLYLLTYIKLLLTIVKCIPQVYLNYRRKSTSGWSIANVLLDFTGGVLSIGQILLDSWITGHWAGISGFLIKLVLGVISLVFDTIFLLQHYYWYPQGLDVSRIVVEKARTPQMEEARPKNLQAE